MGVTKRTKFVDENEVPVEDAIREAVLERDAVTPAPVEVITGLAHSEMGPPQLDPMLSKGEFVPQKLPSIGLPVEVNGKDVRSLPLPLPATMEPVASATPELPYIPPKEKPVKVNATLRFGHRRYKVLTKHITAFLGRLDKWAPPFSIDTEPFRAAWESLGQCLDALVESGADVRITESSKRRSWLKPGAHVELREDIRAEFLAIYTQEELDSLEVVALVGAPPSKALLKTGTREVGLVPLPHLRRPSRVL